MNKLALYAALALSMLLPSAVHAQQIKSLGMEFIQYDQVKIPELGGEDGEFNLFVNEPFFRKVDFKKLEDAYSAQERVERILYGIYTDIPPEYDHYGYEIRRYMASVGDATKFQDTEYLAKQIKNIDTALVILKYWKKVLREDIAQIEKDYKDTRNNIRTMFKYNRGVVTAFLVESESWMTTNKKVLEFLQEIGPKAYGYNADDELMTFKSERHLKEFEALYKAKMKSLNKVRGYLPFRMMVY